MDVTVTQNGKTTTYETGKGIGALLGRFDENGNFIFKSDFDENSIVFPADNIYSEPVTGVSTSVITYALIGILAYIIFR
jgi:hypothetical protein